MIEHATFRDWTARRELSSIGTNFGSASIPFQDWQKFKEAFAPELILQAIEESAVKVHRLLDPFGGSGTSALAAQFAGVSPVTAEVNPYLGDLIEAKLSTYDLASLDRDLAIFFDATAHALSAEKPVRARQSPWLPQTFIEPGRDGRWIFSEDLANFLLTILSAIDELTDGTNRRLIRVIVGGTLVSLSNVRVSGKGRRYRSGWKERQRTPEQAAQTIVTALTRARSDIAMHGARPELSYELLRGDARVALDNLESVDLAIFSPPYPNSFDYTDVYNVELWMLGYLSDMGQNKELRTATLASHVQIKREFSRKPEGSKSLDTALDALSDKREDLWSARIPDMVAGYFGDMSIILDKVHQALVNNGEAWLVVGDSRYAGIDIPVAAILGELAESHSFSLLRSEPFRSMRASPQQGGLRELPETLLVLQKK